jgi:hypothetical protein
VSHKDNYYFYSGDPYEGHRGPLEQGFIGSRLHGTDVNELIHTRYGSLVKFYRMEPAPTIL